jgi:hypothetical protein
MIEEHTQNQFRIPTTQLTADASRPAMVPYAGLIYRHTLPLSSFSSTCVSASPTERKRNYMVAMPCVAAIIGGDCKETVCS